MQTLEYHADRRIAPRIWARCALAALPLIAAGLAFVAVTKEFDEPFAVFSWNDAATFFGSPFVIAGLGAAWYLLARPLRFRWWMIVPVLAWFALLLYAAAYVALFYLHEPWNR